MSQVSSASAASLEPASRSFSHAEIMRVVMGAMVCIFLAALDQTVVIPALPSIASDLGAYGQLSWIVAAYLIASTISTPIYGKLSDIYGRRKLLLACITVFIATSMLCGAAQSLNQLIWFRALQGLGGGGLIALTQSAIADVVSPRERGRYQGYISAMWALTSVSGPLVGGFVVQSLSWRWIFWINLPIGAVALWACHNALRRLLPPVLAVKPKLDVPGMLLLSGALTSLLLALAWAGSVYAWDSPEILGLAGAGLCLLALLLLQERRTPDPLLPPRLFRNTSYVANITVSTLTSVLIFMCLFTIPLYFQLARGANAAQSGVYIVPFMLSSAAGNIISSKWSRRVGAFRGAMRIGTFISLSGLVLLAALPIDVPVWTIIVGLAVAGFGVGICLIGSMTSSQNALLPRDIGSGTGAIIVLRSVGGASGSTLAGTIVAAGLSAHGGAALDAVRSGAAAPVHLGATFATVYAMAGGVVAVSFLVTLLMPNTPLRNTLHVAPLSE